LSSFDQAIILIHHLLRIHHPFIMKLPSNLALMATATTLLSPASAFWKGFNLAANLASGACKSQSDWESDFRLMASLPGHFTSARLYASSDCNTLANAVPAALATGTQLLVGVWSNDEAHYDAEKAALLSAVQQYGFDWIVAVSVGSEDLYRVQSQGSTETSPQRLAQQIYDVRGMLSTVPGYDAGKIQVGHVDTWTAWVDGRNEDVIRACDFVGTNGFPYFQSTQDNSIDNAYGLFWDSVAATRDVVGRVKPGIWVWVTETGWPVKGAQMSQATTSVANAARYWKEVACSAFGGAHTFWYVLSDFQADPSFGVVDQNGQPLYDLSC
jgi:glucan endo-1,3-beta-D-glucosidase